MPWLHSTFSTTVFRLPAPCLCLAAAVVYACGCTSLDLSKVTPSVLAGPKPKTPTRMVAVWSDAVMNQPGLRGVRGIGGRIHFYAKRNDEPIEVDGLLTVYAYDDSDEIDAQSVPVRKFAFLPEQLVKRHSVSKLGHSYSVWLPFDEVGGPTRQLTLIARFEPEGGASVMSDPARQLLPGVIKKEKSETALAKHPLQDASDIELVGYDEPTSSNSPEEGDALETFTIDLPGDVARRWREKATQAVQRKRVARRTVSALPSPHAKPVASPAEDVAAPSDQAPEKVAGVRSRQPIKVRPNPSDLLPRRSIAPEVDLEPEVAVD